MIGIFVHGCSVAHGICSPLPFSDGRGACGWKGRGRTSWLRLLLLGWCLRGSGLCIHHHLLGVLRICAIAVRRGGIRGGVHRIVLWMGGHARAAGGAVHGGWGGIGRGGVVLGEGGRVDGEAGVHHVRDGWVVLERRGTSGAGLGLIRLGESMSMGSRGRGAEDTHQWTRTTADGWDSARGRKRPLSVSSAAPLSTAPWRGLVAAHSTLRRGQAMPFVDAVDRRDSHLGDVDPRNPSA